MCYIRNVSNSGPMKEENNMKHSNLQISFIGVFNYFFFNFTAEEDEIVNFHPQVSNVRL